MRFGRTGMAAGMHMHMGLRHHCRYRDVPDAARLQLSPKAPVHCALADDADTEGSHGQPVCGGPHVSPMRCAPPWIGG